MSQQQNSKSRGFIALGGLAVLTAVTLFGSDPLYQALSSVKKPNIDTPGTYEASAQGYGGEPVPEDSTDGEEAPAVAVNASGHLFFPGTYTAKADGMHEIEVEAAVSEDAIESIRILKHEETPGVSDAALTQIPEDILAAQGLGVDAVAGATLTSNGIIKAVTGCLEQAGGDIEGLKLIKKPEPPKEADQEYTADILVIGGGGAGLAAAVAANQERASVIVLEKMPYAGGNTILSGGALNAVDDGSETALATGDSVQKHYDQTMSGGDNLGDPDLVRILVENAWDGVEWLKGLGMEFDDGTFTAAGGMWPRAHKPADPAGTGFIRTYSRYIKEHDGVEVMLNTEATEIKRGGNGSVNTVVARGKTGNTLTFHANKAVIVASGGFSKNNELCRQYDTQWPSLKAGVKSTNHEGATGDAVPMLERLGADFVQMDKIQWIPLGDPTTGSLTGNIGLDVERRIFVNKNGDRFADEGGLLNDMTSALLEQPDPRMWTVMDSDCYPTGEESTHFNETVNGLIAQGRAVKGETLEELADKMNVPAENLIAAVEDFNTHAEDKSTDDFGRTLYSTLIDTAPYYAALSMPAVHHTMGGVKINAKTQVIDTEGNIIPGLYAAGEVTGGIHGANRLGGNALTETVVFGRIAGKEAAHFNGAPSGLPEPAKSAGPT